ncbi:MULTISPECIES: diacylglycerol kinase [unclassified Coleofasciculus]|uniref:diacylglycerol kinase n=1 Tax=unclassified Coleofasciculus TaxID=2692782 RepID=UPI00187FD41F|nr:MULTISPECIES: diacylglycerol kinase family protein [unclassified Coleofasciculus]MBE9128665.1 diacylglycerol kinase family protein [Coleofasciculus sp. LEGE 07081]MBE9149740.1 diacylglycerol kinase family protein [Coleofasciculus sp. LEGE 07092]
MIINKTHISNSHLFAPSSLAVSPELPISTSTPVDSSVKPKRELAWCIAPTLLISFKYAWAGLYYAFITQRNFRIHTIIGTLAVSLGVFLHLAWIEIAVIGVTSGLVMAMELLNTALESVVDLTVKQSYHELAKIAKDCAAGAVLISALTAVFVAGVLLLPPLFARIQSLV